VLQSPDNIIFVMDASIGQACEAQVSSLLMFIYLLLIYLICIHICMCSSYDSRSE